MPKNLKYSALLDIYERMLTDKQKDALDLYYNEDLSLAEISENLDISRQGAMDLIRRAEAQIDSLEEKLGLSLIYKNIDSAIDDLLSILNDSEDEELNKNIKSIIDRFSR